MRALAYRGATAIVVALAALAVSAPASARMLFDSEFNPGHLNWAIRSGGGYYQGQCWASDQRHVFKWRGLLQLTATYEPSGGTCGTSYESGAVYIPDNWWHYTYGWASARVRLPCQGGFGVWPSFWQYDQAFASNAGGEIDTFEDMDVTARPRRTVEQSLYSVGSQLVGTLTTQNRVPWCRAFHVFANHWQPGSVSFYVDGRHTHTLYASGHTLPESPVLSLLVGYYGGLPRPWTFPQSMLVDWVRIWR